MNGVWDPASKSSEISPVFLQWLECVEFVRRQHPSAFGFNEEYLVMIACQLDSGHYGDFAFDNEKVGNSVVGTEFEFPGKRNCLEKLHEMERDMG